MSQRDAFSGPASFDRVGDARWPTVGGVEEGRVRPLESPPASEPDPSDSVLQRAFELAYFICPDRDRATRIVVASMAKLEVAVAVQDKRLYYRPLADRLRRPAIRRRNRVSFDEPQLLQRLIYIESEPYEREDEARPGEADEHDLVVHYIKHLVRLTTKRNSFYVNLGINRLLYNYTTAETMGIYNVVVQDPERVKDDYYYRSRKTVLMGELQARFGDLLSVVRVHRGEERFESRSSSAPVLSLVRECLERFTPWGTSCVVPRRFDPHLETVPSLEVRREAEQNAVELNRMHSVLHPECFHRLVAALGLEAGGRLDLPRLLPRNGSPPSRNRNDRRPPPLQGQELDCLKGLLTEQARRRRQSRRGILRLYVDGDGMETTGASWRDQLGSLLARVRAAANGLWVRRMPLLAGASAVAIAVAATWQAGVTTLIRLRPPVATPSASPLFPTPPPVSAGRATPPGREAPSAATGRTVEGAGGTRGSGVPAAARSLREVRRLHLGLPAGSPWALQVRQVLIDRLQRSGRLRLTDEPEAAEAELKAVFEAAAPSGEGASRGGLLRAQAVNARGEVLWPARRADEWARYRGPIELSASRLADDLLRAAGGDRPGPSR
jgi:hypothetical protein